MPKYKLITCKTCGKEKEQPTSTRLKYCSIQCQQNYQLEERAEHWMMGRIKLDNRALRRVLTFLRGYHCEVCRISEWNNKPITLEVEHKNGNSSDDSPNNVCLLCPNCHSQTPTYKGANKGNGRHYRRMRYAEGKSY